MRHLHKTTISRAFISVCVYECGYFRSIQLSKVLNEASKDAFYMYTNTNNNNNNNDHVSYSRKEACNMKRSGTQVNEREGKMPAESRGAVLCPLCRSEN